MKSAPLLRAQRLTKRFGTKTVVDGFDVTCHRGKVTGLLGSNGAGKTTTIRMLYGLLTPDSGQIEYNGRDFAQHRTELKRRLGVCTQDDTLDHDFTVVQNLEIFASYFRPKVEKLGERIDELIESFGLGEFRNHTPIMLSGGYKQRLMIARSIIHRPDILFLDEPTTGLDPQARVAVWDVIASLRAQGMGIVLTTHYMDEAEKLSDELVVMDKGRSVASGSARGVIRTMVGDHIVEVQESDDVARRRRKWHETHPQTRSCRVLGSIRFAVRDAELADLRVLLGEIEMVIRPPTLDDLFLVMAESGAASEPS